MCHRQGELCHRQGPKAAGQQCFRCPDHAVSIVESPRPSRHSGFHGSIGTRASCRTRTGRFSEKVGQIRLKWQLCSDNGTFKTPDWVNLVGLATPLMKISAALHQSLTSGEGAGESAPSRNFHRNATLQRLH
jgi:hypothetical protein